MQSEKNILNDIYNFRFPKVHYNIANDIWAFYQTYTHVCKYKQLNLNVLLLIDSEKNIIANIL